jgi:hypothetical protein
MSLRHCGIGEKSDAPPPRRKDTDLSTGQKIFCVLSVKRREKDEMASRCLVTKTPTLPLSRRAFQRSAAAAG